jgi:hypothetical protein
MPVTQVFSNGVKYIKIAKLDSGSIDQSIELQNLTDIRIKFSDISNPIQYNVASIAEYPTYYLYTIVPLNVTSSADQEILDYKVSGSSTTLTSNTISNYSILTGTNTLGYLNPTTGIYTPSNTPNISLNFTCSVTGSAGGISVNGPFYFAFGEVDNTGTFINTPLYNEPVVDGWPGGPGIYNVSGSFLSSVTPIEGKNYGFGIYDPGGSLISFTSGKISLTQSYATQSSNYDMVVLEPYVGANFYNSDCNVVQNNVSTNVVSPFYMDVDFTNSPIVAQNQAAVLNGTATRAEVQSWNYTYFSQISGRYLGKQLNAIALNEYTGPTNYVNGSSSIYGYTGSWSGDSTSPSIPIPGNIVIQWLDSCIYEINWGGGGYPENTNGGGINVGNIYLVGETKDDVAIIKPGTDIYYDILEKTFPSGSPAFQYQYTNTTALPNQLSISYPALGLPNAKYYVSSNFGQNSNEWWGLFYPTGSTTFPGESYINIEYDQNTYTSNANINNNSNLFQDDNTSIMNYYLLEGLSSSLSQGEKWFISFYSGSGTGTINSTTTDGYYLNGLTTGLPPSCSGGVIDQIGYPFEIDRIDFVAPGENHIVFKNTTDIKYWFETGSTYQNLSPIGIGAIDTPSYSNNMGILITKADYPNNGFTIFGISSQNFGGAGQGYILSQYPKRVITENIDYILRTYGNKP